MRFPVITKNVVARILETPQDTVSLVGKFSNSICGVYYTTPFYWFELYPDTPSDTFFPDDAAAEVGGVTPGQPFPIHAGNPWGLPEGFFKVYQPGFTYHNDGHAVNRVGYDVGYPLDVNNPYGSAGCDGLVRFVPQRTTTYSSDSEALSAGLQVGDIYVLEASSYGFTGYYLKKIL